MKLPWELVGAGRGRGTLSFQQDAASKIMLKTIG